MNKKAKKSTVLSIVVCFVLIIAIAIPVLANALNNTEDNPNLERQIIEAFCEEECSICDDDEMQQLKQFALEEGFLLDPHLHDYLANLETVTISMEDLKEQYPNHYALIIESLLEEGLDPYSFTYITTSSLGMFDSPDSPLSNSNNATTDSSCRVHFWGDFKLDSSLTVIVHSTNGPCMHVHSGCQVFLTAVSTCTACGDKRTNTTSHSHNPCGGCSGCNVQHSWGPLLPPAGWPWTHYRVCSRCGAWTW